MKKNLFFALLMLCSLASVAQTKTQEKKWKFRARLIAAIPPSVSYKNAYSLGDVKISTSVVPEVDFTYFFNKNFAAELILGTTKHTVKLNTTELSNVWLLPPTLNLQYHIPTKGFTPYFGAGINYTFFYGVKDKNGFALDYQNGFGFSTQLGADIDISKNWYLNIDIKKLFLKSDVGVKSGTTTLPTLQNVKIDPFVIGIGIGTRF
ncbi:MAG: hypothetical protein RLY16_834 [Bacteroidota bacterium]|jgi:outer membrane protein